MEAARPRMDLATGLAVREIAPTRQALLAETLQHPLTLIPGAAGLVGLAAVAVQGPTLVALATAGAGLALGGAGWLVNYFLRPHVFVRARLRAVHREIEWRKRQALARLDEELRALGGRGWQTLLKRGRAPVEDLAKRANAQLGMIQQRFDSFRALLSTRLSPAELTYGRYYIAAEQVLLAVLDNLQGVAGRLQSIRHIDSGYAEERLRALRRVAAPTHVDGDEVASLEKRLALREEQLVRVGEILAQHERALTELDRVNTAIAEMRAMNDYTSMDLQTATEELEELARRAQQFR